MDNSSKVLLPNDVRRLLNVDNKEIVELCKKIRNDDDNSITPIIVVSSNSEQKHRIDILKQSVEYFIKKPVNTQYLYFTNGITIRRKYN